MNERRQPGAVKRFVWVSALGLLPLAAIHAGATTVGEIAKNPAAFDQKTVVVSGTATSVTHRTSWRGNPYTTFHVADQGQSVKVFRFGTPTIKDDESVDVRGVFQRVKHVGQYTF